jgi:L-fuconolactonase
VIIDAHQHVWDLERAEYPWLGPALGAINRTIDFDELVPTLDACGISGSVLVQAADNAADTDVMLEVARRNPRVAAVVAWAPLDRPDELASRLEWLAERSVVRGVRNLFHARPRKWATSPDVMQGLELVAASSLALDFVTSSPPALADVAMLGERLPTLRIVIDHLGKPPVGGTALERAEWRALLSAAAANPLTFAKISGLYASVGDMADWSLDGIRPFVDDAFELFGADRLMYGGDWPISELAGGYERTWVAVGDLIAPLSEGERHAILGATAANFYHIEPWKAAL